MSIVPPKRPELTRAAALQWLAEAGVNTLPALVGRRGYYRDSMGKPGVQERGIYDDAIALVTRDGIITFNANTDPSKHGGRLAVLAPGVWSYKLGTHHPGTPGAYPCLVQAGPVTVNRDNGVTESGEFYIHIHRGGYTTTGSEGCQTIHPDQWGEFIRAVQFALKASSQRAIPYALVAREDEKAAT